MRLEIKEACVTLYYVHGMSNNLRGSKGNTVSLRYTVRVVTRGQSFEDLARRVGRAEEKKTRIRSIEKERVP